MARARRRGFRRRLADRAEMAGAQALLFATRGMGVERLSGLLGRLGGWALPRTPGLRARVARNLEAVRPGAGEAEARRLCAEVGENFSRLVAEYLRLDEIAAQPERLEIEGAEAARAALEAGRGVVIVTAHFGNWEAIRLALRQAAGRDCALIYRAFNNPRFDPMAQRIAAQAGAPVLHKGREGTRALLRHVGRGGAAMVLIDQRQTGAPLLPFLGREAETATAAAELARRFGAALIPARARRLPGTRFEVRFEPEIPPGTAEEMTAAANARLSAWIEADPGQWFWLHRRWRLRPRGERIRAARGG